MNCCERTMLIVSTAAAMAQPGSDYTIPKGLIQQWAGSPLCCDDCRDDLDRIDEAIQPTALCEDTHKECARCLARLIAHL